MSVLLDQIEHLIDQKALGRSKRYEELLRYLGKREIENSPPTELEIAVEVFAKGNTYDPNVDTVVRVYAHNLRKKLKEYYSDPRVAHELVITIPPGGYKLEFTTPTPYDDRPPKSERIGFITSPTLKILATSAVLLICLTGLLLSHNLNSNKKNQSEELPEFWQFIAESDREAIIVYGDLYAFSLWDDQRTRKLKIRDFSVNSQDDFNSQTFKVEGMRPYWEDETILNNSDMQSVHLISQMLAPFKETSILPSSQLSPEVIRDNNIIFVGNLKALRLLDGYFRGSQFKLTENQRYLVNKSTDEVLVLNRENKTKKDLALLAKIDGPQGGQIIILGGNVGEGILALSEVTTDNKVLDTLLTEHLQGDKAAHNFEILIEAFGLRKGSYTSHRVLSVHDVDVSSIWSFKCANSDC